MHSGRVPATIMTTGARVLRTADSMDPLVIGATGGCGPGQGRNLAGLPACWERRYAPTGRPFRLTGLPSGSWVALLHANVEF
jgi:hypothetical protein